MFTNSLGFKYVTAEERIDILKKNILPSKIHQTLYELILDNHSRVWNVSVWFPEAPAPKTDDIRLDKRFIHVNFERVTPLKSYEFTGCHDEMGDDLYIRAYEVEDVIVVEFLGSPDLFFQSIPDYNIWISSLANRLISSLKI